MKKNNNEFLTVLSLSAPRLINGSYSIIASSHYLSSSSLTFGINSNIFAEKLEKVYNGNLKILAVDEVFTETRMERIGDSFANNFYFLEVPAELFFSKEGIENILIKNKNINQYIFILKDVDYGTIVTRLALYNVILSGGSNTKKHILSPIQLRLARFLIPLLSGGGSDVANSFHIERIKGRAKVDFTSNEVKEKRLKYLALIDKENREAEANFQETSLKTQPRLDDKDKSKGETENKISLNLTIPTPSSNCLVNRQKREFHSSSLSLKTNQRKLETENSSSNIIEVAPVPLNTLSKINTKSTGMRSESSILSYLDSIQSIINNPDNTPLEAQSLIENTWMSILMEQLNDEKKLINKYSSRFSKILLEANKTLHILQENNIIRKKFPKLYKDLDDINLIFISYTLCLSYSNGLGYTALIELVGNNIIYYLFKKSDCYNLQEFKNQLRNSNTISYKLGDFFITLLTQFPHDLFERNISPSSYYTKEVATLNINSEYLEDIKNNIVVHPYTLPMVCEPNIWSEESFGGFLDNVNKEEGIITGSHRHSHSVENKEALFKSVNYLSSLKFSINNMLLDYLKNEGNFLLDFIKADNDLQRDITLKIADSFSKIPFYLNVHAD